MKRLFLAVMIIVCTLGTVACYGDRTASYSVTFQSNGGSAVTTQWVKSGGYATQPDDPTREGFKFVMWSTSQSGATRFDFETQAVTANVTLYAVWAELFTVSFDTDGGSAVSSQSIADGERATPPTAPTKSGYTFQHWSKTAGGAAYSFDTAVTSSFTLYAVFQADKTPAEAWNDLIEEFINNVCAVDANYKMVSSAHNVYSDSVSDNVATGTLDGDKILMHYAYGDDEPYHFYYHMDGLTLYQYEQADDGYVRSHQTIPQAQVDALEEIVGVNSLGAMVTGGAFGTHLLIDKLDGFDKDGDVYKANEDGLAIEGLLAAFGLGSSNTLTKYNLQTADGKIVGIELAFTRSDVPEPSTATISLTFGGQSVELPTEYTLFVPSHTVFFYVGGVASYEEVKDGGSVARPDDPTASGQVFVRWEDQGNPGVPFDFSAPIVKDTTIIAVFRPMTDEEMWVEILTFFMENMCKDEANFTVISVIERFDSNNDIFLYRYDNQQVDGNLGYSQTTTYDEHGSSSGEYFYELEGYDLYTYTNDGSNNYTREKLTASQQLIDQVEEKTGGFSMGSLMTGLGFYLDSFIDDADGFDREGDYFKANAKGLLNSEITDIFNVPDTSTITRFDFHVTGVLLAELILEYENDVDDTYGTIRISFHYSDAFIELPADYTDVQAD